MILEIKKERVLKAAEKCGDAKNILKELFPEVFEQEFKPGRFYKDELGGVVVCYDESDDAKLFKGICVNPEGCMGIGNRSNFFKNKFKEISNPFK